MTISIYDLGELGDRAILLLAASRFRSPQRWQTCAFVFTDLGSPRIVRRSELAEELYASDVPALAHECIARRVPPGHVLGLVNVEVQGRAPITRFVVLQLLGQQGKRVAA